MRPIEYRDPELGFTIAFPQGSEVDRDVPGTAVVAYDAGVEDAFRTNLVITVDDGAADVEAYTDAGLEAMASALRAFQLLDRASTTLGGEPATRTLAHHDAQGWAVTVEQWRVVHGGRGYTITASSATLDYDAVADTLAEAAESFRP
jgi:hypothetical protein